MKTINILITAVTMAAAALQTHAAVKPLRVVTTLPDYASIAKTIGGGRVEVQAIVKGGQDAHFIRPKPSFVEMVRKADVLIDTGLDLEMWLPTVIDKSGNKNIRSGQIGYIAASKGVHMLEKPHLMSRSEGGLHIYGNPHITCSPINMRTAARNIAAGLIKNDPAGKTQYVKGLNSFINKIDEKMFGRELVKMLGGDILCNLTEKGKLIPFLKQQKYKDKALIEYLGGWQKKMLPMYGLPIVTYHKNWVYFTALFGLENAGTIEPKPGIPPSPKHVLSLIQMMKTGQIKIILAANYFDEHKIRTIAAKVDAEPVIVSSYVGGQDNTANYFDLVDMWVDSLLAAAHKSGLIK